MIIEMGYLFNRKGSTLPVELVEKIDDVKDYPDVVEFVEPVRIEGTLKNEDDVFVLDAKGVTTALMECSSCLAPVMLLSSSTSTTTCPGLAWLYWMSLTRPIL